MISRAAEYGLRTVLCLAKQSGRPTASRCLAAATGVPASYQSKILQGLERVGIVRACRGVGGGFVLARPAENLSIKDVIDAVDPPWFAGTGPRGTEPFETLWKRLREGVGLMQSHFASISIAEVCRDPAAGPAEHGLPQDPINKGATSEAGVRGTRPTTALDRATGERSLPIIPSSGRALAPAPLESTRMALDSHQPVGEIVGQRLARARVFDQLSIDYCCHGQTPLDLACVQRGLNVADVLARVQACDAEPDDHPEPDFATMSLGALADHIEATHHTYLRVELPQLEQLHATALAAHRERHPELIELATLLAVLREELDAHLMKEERILFPMIRQLEAEATLPRFHCGSVANPIRVMEHEHDIVGGALARMRQLTHGFVAPSDGCSSYRSFMARLAGLEADIHRHIHKENNLLFPRAAALEAERAASQS